MNVVQTQLESFTERLANGRPFTFSRWGDGEWWSVLGRTQNCNCDKHPYTKELGCDLRAVLESRPEYLLGMQPLAMKMRVWPHIDHYLTTHRLDTLDWINADVFHEASDKEVLTPFLEELRKHPLLVIGPAHLRVLEKKFLTWDAFIEVPSKNSYQALSFLLAEATHALLHSRAGTVVSISAGMPGKLIAHALHQLGLQRTIIDFGSLWDYFAGKRSRQYMRRKPPYQLGE